MGGRGGGAPGNAGRGEAANWKDQVPPTEGPLGYPERRPLGDTNSDRAIAAERAIIELTPGLPESLYPGWRVLSTLRDALSARGFSVQEQDAGIYRAGLNPRVRIAPAANLKAVVPEVRRGAMYLGGEWKHIISVEGM